MDISGLGEGIQDDKKVLEMMIIPNLLLIF